MLKHGYLMVNGNPKVISSPSVVYFTLDFLDSRPSYVQLKSQPRFWVNFVCRDFGLPHCSVLCLEISCLHLQPLHLSWIFISISQSNNMLTFFMNCITSVSCRPASISRRKLGKNCVLSPVNSIFVDLQFLQTVDVCLFVYTYNNLVQTTQSYPEAGL